MAIEPKVETEADSEAVLAAIGALTTKGEALALASDIAEEVEVAMTGPLTTMGTSVTEDSDVREKEA